MEMLFLIALVYGLNSAFKAERHPDFQSYTLIILSFFLLSHTASHNARISVTLKSKHQKWDFFYFYPVLVVIHLIRFYFWLDFMIKQCFSLNSRLVSLKSELV